MKRIFRSAVAGALAATVWASVSVSLAQTPAQMEYERQQREYWRQQEQQRQEQERQQRILQENARKQQESYPVTGPQGQGAAGQTGTPAQMRGGASQAAADNLSAARAAWEKKPPLPPDKNPLLGKWTRPTSSQSKSSDPFAQLAALAKGGLCEVLFGGGVFEFRTDKLVGMDERTREQELDKVEYRGDAKHVVVLPKTTIKLMEWDFDGPNRINWKSQNCVLVRVGAQPSQAKAAAGTVTGGSTASAASAGADGTAAAAASAGTTAAAASAGASARAASVPPSKAGGKLDLSVAALAPGYNIAGRKLWVLKEDAQVALIKGGVTSTPDGSVLQNWIRACTSHTPLCEKGANALKAYSVGLATTDATGHALTPPLPAGRYWVLADAKVANKRVVWNAPVDVKGGDKALTLDVRNAMPVD